MPDWPTRLPLVLLLAGCPSTKEIGGLPEDDGSSSAGVGETEMDPSTATIGESETGDAPPVDGPVDCATIDADADTVAGGPLGALGFPPPCSPRASGGGTWTCCSDDPAAQGGELPAYEGKGIDGTTPIFSGGNNAIGTSGLCVRTSDIPVGSGLLEPQAANCPIPCNPTWDAGSIATVCGGNRVCCQTQELQPEDCILDGDVWRPVTGEDIGNGTDWANNRHATHQDPGGVGCNVFAGGSGQGNPAWVDCIAQLTVADQRGYCMALQPGQACPAAVPGYLDACMQINMGLIPPPVPG
jgi:hypothetical protein